VLISSSSAAGDQKKIKLTRVHGSPPLLSIARSNEFASANDEETLLGFEAKNAPEDAHLITIQEDKVLQPIAKCTYTDFGRSSDLIKLPATQWFLRARTFSDDRRKLHRGNINTTLVVYLHVYYFVHFQTCLQFMDLRVIIYCSFS